MTQVDFYDKEQVDDLLGAKANSADVYTKTEANTLLSSKANIADLAAVAISGSYTDLSNKPAIPVGVTKETLNPNATNALDTLIEKLTAAPIGTIFGFNYMVVVDSNNTSRAFVNGFMIKNAGGNWGGSASGANRLLLRLSETKALTIMEGNFTAVDITATSINEGNNWYLYYLNEKNI